ncbi:hypothetical protein JZ751_000596 [Albula glossodonta]|uniref:Uncharacterized protein n=1 Tax=Albula glossodonta TaxID=121402 RepID=A0A8T2PWV0_9TELE|nr:hypothetical protein JZ751_000596 [Albula glossodonta]
MNEEDTFLPCQVPANLPSTPPLHLIASGTHWAYKTLSWTTVNGPHWLPWDCPCRVLSLYRAQGMMAEMNWREFQQSAFYEAEKQRWALEKGK